MKVKNLTKRMFALLLALILALTPMLAAPVTAEAATDNFYRILHLDNGRKYFTVDWIKALINEMKAAGFTHLELAFGNDGLRFLLDDMSVGAYSDADVTAAIQSGNKAYNTKKSYSTSVNELTQAEMDEIIAHANAVGIEIIPLLNNPGHMYTLITAMTSLGMTPGYNGSASTVDLQDTAAIAFVKGLLQKYVNYFSAKGCKVFNIGADEYANDNYSSGSMGFGHLMSSGKYQLFVDYVNELNAMIKAAGMKTMAFNDGIYFQGKTSYAFDTDIMVSFWTSGWGSYYSLSAKNMASKGHPMINTHGDYYYILGVNDTYTPGTTAYHTDGYHTAASGFSNTSFMSSTVSNPAGSMFCVWADYPGAETETEVARYIRPIMRVMGARMQSSSSYEVDSIVEGGFNVDGTINVPAHTYEATTVAATCTANGQIIYTCTDCGDSYTEEIPALGHSYESVVTGATCDQAGYTTYTCAVCGDSYTTDEVAALGHNYKATVTDATCGVAGSTVYTCATCGDSYSEKIPALEHNYKSVVTEPTCDKAGSTVYTCANCGHSYAEEIPALGHDYESVVTAPTCDKAGFTTYTCAACGDSYTADQVAALGHDYESETVEADCTTDGGTVHTCTVCGDSYIDNKVAAYGHDYKTTTVDATCETAGSVTTTCAVCGDKTVETIPALSHAYETVTVEATCETAGSVSKSCTRCGDETVEILPALGHDYKTTTVDATCEAAGSVTTACANCGDETVEVIPALGHNYQTTTVDATCEADGSVTTACANCGEKTVEVIPALGHDTTTTTVDATCEAAGSVTTACAHCGETTVETIPALGHDYETVTVEATCETAGSVTETCKVCGDVTVETIPALGHNYKTVAVDATCEAAGSVTNTCATCGSETVETIAALGHNYKTTTVDATCEADGSVTTACANCGDKTVKVIPALGHDYSSVTVSATCTAGGYTYHSCSNCGDSYTSDQTAALGHSYNAVQDGNNMVYTCATCGDSYSESLAVNYTYDKVSVFTADENFVITLYSNRKYYAVTHANNTLSVQQVTVSGNQITSEITEDMLWTYKSGKLSYTSGNNTYYLYASTSYSWGGWFGWGNSTTTLKLSTTNSSTVSFSRNSLKVGSYYLRYSGGKVSLNRSATTTYLFRQNEE